jgi:type VI secretion system protein ImpE
LTVSADEALAGGDLDGALATLQDSIRAKPDDAKLRIFLFQLLCVLGDWNRAITQLKLCAQMDASAIPMAQTYREAIICEVFREKVFAGEKDPLVFGEPEEWVALLIEANKLLAQGKPAEATALRDRAFDAAPATAGEMDGEAFEWIADADMRLGPVLETIVNGRYFWLPFAAISSLKIEEPADLRDAVWTAGTMTLQNGGEHVVLIPTRYPGTAQSADPSQKLARSTDWQDAGSETFTGLGQRLLTTEGGDKALMDLRHLQMAPGSVSDGG